MSEKYLIEYCEGCRGDFLCNFLNFNKVSLLYKNSMSKTFYAKIKELSTQSFKFKKPPNYIELEDALKNANHQYTPCHSLEYFDEKCMELIKNLNFKILKICFKEKFYNVVYTDYVFKAVLIDMYKDKTDENKQILFEKYLSNNFKIDLYEKFNNQNNKNKIILNYEDLFYNIKIENYFPSIDVENYKNLLKRAELGREIELWGKKYYPADYGYIWNEELQ